MVLDVVVPLQDLGGCDAFRRESVQSRSIQLDNFTQAAALFSGIKVKPRNGGAIEAQVQVST